jgi:hypothetical protein
MRTPWLVLLVLVSVLSAGCEIIGDIFQAGLWVGAILVILVVAAVAAIARRIRR